VKHRPTIAPRLLTKQDAAAYVGVCAATFDRVCPVTPIALGEGDRLLRFDVRDLDRFIDSLGRSTRDSAPGETDLLQVWTEGQGECREPLCGLRA
jgi:hypothetical protein